MNESEVRIRRAERADADRIVALWQEMMDFHKARDPFFTQAADGHERFKEFVAAHLASETSCLVVAEQGETVVGYCLASLAAYPPVFEMKQYGFVSDLAVTARCRRSGIGKALCRAAEAWFAEHGIHRIEVRFLLSNEVSTSFWKKSGYAPYLVTAFKDI